jgi:predicted RNase H-like nuclease (RuvC/YqgF family)
MKDVATLVSGIEYKLGKLIEQHHLQRTDNAKFISEIQELKQVINEQKQTIRQLEDKIKLLKIAKTLETKEGNVEAKLKINELVREIDKCIGLLNT